MKSEQVSALFNPGLNLGLCVLIPTSDSTFCLQAEVYFSLETVRLFCYDVYCFSALLNFEKQFWKVSVVSQLAHEETGLGDTLI